MAFYLPTSVDTAADFIPSLTSTATRKLPNIPQQFSSAAALAAALVVERANIDLGLAIWTTGQVITVATEWPAARRWFVGSTGALSHAREAQLPGGKVITLASDAAIITTTSGAPSSGAGADDDVRYDLSGNAYYTKAAGAWALTSSLYPVSGAGKTQSAPLGPVAGHMGDSHTFGTGASNGGTRGYVAVTRQRLGGLLLSPASINAGIGGTDSANMVSRMPALIAQSPALITLMAGTNDALGGVSASAYSANIAAMIGMARAASIPIYVGSPPPIAPSNPASVHKLLESYAAAVRQLCAANGVRYVQVWEALADPSTGYQLAAHASGDGTHYNDRGHAAMSVPWASVIGADAFVPPRAVAAKSRHNTITNPLIQGAIGVGLPTGIAVNGTPTGTAAVYSVKAKASGDKLAYGNWLQIEWDATGVDSYVEININPNINPTVGDTLVSSYVYEIDGVSAPWADLVVAGAEVVVNLVVGASYVGGANVGYADSGAVIYRAAAPAAAAYAFQRLRITRKAGQAMRVRIGEVGVLNETTAGVQFV